MATCPFSPFSFPWPPGNHEFYDGEKLTRYLNQTEGSVIAEPKGHPLIAGASTTANTALGRLLATGNHHGVGTHGAGAGPAPTSGSVPSGMVGVFGVFGVFDVSTHPPTRSVPTPLGHPRSQSSYLQCNCHISRGHVHARVQARAGTIASTDSHHRRRRRHRPSPPPPPPSLTTTAVTVPPGTSRYYSVDFGLVHFVALDLNLYNGVDTCVEPCRESQLAWLKADLEAATKNRDNVPWIVAMSHFPLYCSNCPAPGHEPGAWWNSEECEFMGHDQNCTVSGPPVPPAAASGISQAMMVTDFEPIFMQ